MPPLPVVVCFAWYFETPQAKLNMKTQISRPALKPKPTKAFKVLVLFNIFTAMVSGGVHELTSLQLDYSTCSGGLRGRRLGQLPGHQGRGAPKRGRDSKNNWCSTVRHSGGTVWKSCSGHQKPCPRVGNPQVVQLATERPTTSSPRWWKLYYEIIYIN